MKNLTGAIHRPVSIAPLVTFRILFGGLMAAGALRFMLSGWIERLYAEPVFFFKYYGFGWVPVLDVPGMYAVYAVIALSALCVMLGLYYRAAIVVFFFTFTYSELTDLTNYLNHYYLVCLLAFLLILLPAHRRFSLDVRRRPAQRLDYVPAWTINVLILQLSIVYFCAGYAKLNADWLLRAMPLAVWLPAKSDLPLIGGLFTWSWAPFAFSWAGAFYDLTIPFFLLNRRTRPYAYAAVVVFHTLTKLLFNIGLFPFIMIFNTLIFFPARVHERLLGLIGYRGGVNSPQGRKDHEVLTAPTVTSNFRLPISDLRFPTSDFRLPPFLILFFLLQLALPFRYLLYPGNVLWTEEGYRFAWRVMLVEKVGQATFYVSDPATGRRGEVINSDYLTSFQEKQMAIQPDFILQFAHFLAREYRQRHGFTDPVVTVDCHVALNGRASRRLIDPEVNLAAVRDGLGRKTWILPFQNDKR